MRCTKEKLIYGDKQFEVYKITGCPAATTQFKIILDSLFFDIFNKREQEAILYHELYHQKLTTIFKLIFNTVRFRSFKKARWQEEFDADKYASTISGKSVVVSVLKQFKKLYKTNKVVYNEKSHPHINERISRIE